MFRTVFGALVMSAALTTVVGPAEAQPRQVQVGQLTCSVSASVGLIVGSQRNINCVFRGQPGAPEESYTGTMTKVGLDVGFTTGGNDRLDRVRRYQSSGCNARWQVCRGHRR